MKLFTAVKTAFKDLAITDRRASCSEFGYIWGFYTVLLVISVMLDFNIVIDRGFSLTILLTYWWSPDVFPFFNFNFYFWLIPLISVTVRRLHDINKSAWSLWMLFVPIGNLVFIDWLAAHKGDTCPNRYGLPPEDELSTATPMQGNSTAVTSASNVFDGIVNHIRSMNPQQMTPSNQGNPVGYQQNAMQGQPFGNVSQQSQGAPASFAQQGNPSPRQS